MCRRHCLRHSPSPDAAPPPPPPDERRRARTSDSYHSYLARTYPSVSTAYSTSPPPPRRPASPPGPRSPRRQTRWARRGTAASTMGLQVRPRIPGFWSYEHLRAIVVFPDLSTSYVRSDMSLTSNYHSLMIFVDKWMLYDSTPTPVNAGGAAASPG